MKLQYGLIDINGKTIVDFIYDEITPFNNEYLKFQKGSKYGLIDKSGKIILDSNYTSINQFSENLLLAENYHLKEYIFFDANFNQKIKLNLQSCSVFSNGLARVEMDSKYGYINFEGELVIDYQFYQSGNFDNGYAWVKNNKSEFALIDKKGKIVVDYFYAEDILDFRKFPFRSNHAMIVSTNDKNIKQYDLLEKNASIENGQPAVFNEDAFEGVRLFNNNTAIVKYLGKWHIFDLEEAIIIGDAYDLITDDQLKYEELVEPFQNCDVAFAIRDGRAGIIDQKGKLIVDIQFDLFKPFSNGYASVGIKNGSTELWGVIDVTGKFISELKYTNITNFYDSYACVCKKIAGNYRWAFINSKGDEVSDFIYLNKGFFSENKCCLKIEDAGSTKWIIVDSSFQTIKSTDYNEYYELGRFNNGVVKISHEISQGKCGFMKANADLITKFEFDTWLSKSFKKNMEISIVAKKVAQKINISNTKVFNGLEIYYLDEYDMDFEEAKLSINKLKNEWRLPDLVELIQIYSNKETIGLDINYGNTLTSEIDEETEDLEFEYQFVWTINFNNGLQESTPASNSYNIILVKKI